MTSETSRLVEKTFLARNGQRTFQNDEHLPDLPLPALRDTLNRYLESVRAIASDGEYEASRRVVQEFEQGAGGRLHQTLLERCQHSRNWLEQWWDDYAYLYYREPIVPSLCFAGPLPLTDSLWPPGEGKQCLYLARALHSAAEFWFLLRHERLTPHRARDGSALSMYQWRHLFSTVRLPDQHKDSIRALFKTKSEGLTPTHFVVLCNGRLFSCSLLDPTTELPLGVEELQLVLQRVSDRCQHRRGPGLAALTSDRRARWAQNREYLSGLSTDNARALHTVESAICHAVLDLNAGRDNSCTLKQLLCGDLRNRWVDKSLTLVSFTDGYGGDTCDHSPMDAMPLITLSQHAYMSGYDNNVFGRKVLPSIREHLCNPEELRFTVDHRITAAIQTALSVSQPLADDVKLTSRKYTTYGKSWIQSQGFHPDAYIQMALQLAYFRLHGRAAPVYETATTRRYYRGRTETVRSCTTQSISFCRAMCSESSTNIDRRRLLVCAVDRHVLEAREAARGHGCDRHLFALRILSEQQMEKTPRLFLDPMWRRTGGDCNFALSTSTSGYTPCHAVTVAMIRDGYGCFYSIDNEQVNMNVSSYHSSSECCCDRFYNVLEASLDSMQQLLLDGPSSRL